jgi:hypothetical protein
LLARALGELPRVIVDSVELLAMPIRLLEVVAHDLVLALRLLVEPSRDLLVELGPNLLR